MGGRDLDTHTIGLRLAVLSTLRLLSAAGTLSVEDVKRVNTWLKH